jgi:capsular polysaccharide biosynthesis protein
MPDTHSPDTDFRCTFSPKELKECGDYVHITLTADHARKLRDALVYDYPIVTKAVDSFEATHEINGGWRVWRTRAAPRLERTCIAEDLTNKEYAHIFVDALNANAKAAQA